MPDDRTLIDRLRELCELLGKRDRTMHAKYGNAFRIQSMSFPFPGLLAEMERLESQNTKLRELVGKAYYEGFYEDEYLDDVEAWDESETKKELEAL